MNMFKLFKYMNGVFFFKVQVYEWSEFSDFSEQIYIKITSRYSHTTRGESLKHELSSKFLYAYSLDS